MSTKAKRVRSNRRYSEEFKRSRVQDFERGDFSVSQLGRLYGIHEGIIYRWLQRYSHLPAKQAVIMEVPNSQAKRLQLLENRLAAAEQALGRKQVELDFCKELLQLCKEQGFDWEKKTSGMKLPGDLFTEITKG